MLMRAERAKSKRFEYVYITILCILVCSANSASSSTEKHAIPQVRFKNLSSLSAKEQLKVKEWISFGIKANQHVLGAPGKTPLYYIDLKPRYLATEPVPWARIIRGEVDKVELHFYRYASLRRLKNDWTLYHELSHLYHPLFDYKDFWLAEGLATYLQNRVMFENGLVSHAEFYHRVSSGLQRGMVNTKQNKGRLSEVSEDMWQRDAFQRVYWTGVAFFIEAEHALKVKNKPNLTALITRYQNCCRGNEQYASEVQAQRFLQSLDKLSRSAIFMSLYLTYRHREDFPVISDNQIRSLIAPITFK